VHATQSPSSTTGLGWNSHKPVSGAPPATLCRPDDSNADTTMRSKFEKMCREAQDSICAAIEELDGGATFKEDAWTREGARAARPHTRACRALSVVCASRPRARPHAAAR
jgi:hypothetical protein